MSIYMIINTYDKQIVFAKLIYLQYKKLLAESDLKFIYRIPYNSEQCLELDFFKNCSDVELIKTPRPIKATIKFLLSGIDDRQMIYWAIDDRIPISIDIENFGKLYNYVKNLNKKTMGKDAYYWIGRFSTHYQKSDMKLKKDGPLIKLGNITYQSLSSKMLHQRFWKHHFINTGLMKFLLLGKHIPENAGPGWLARYLKKFEKNRNHIPFYYKTVAESNYFPDKTTILVDQIESCKGRENKVKDGEKRDIIPFVTKDAKELLKNYGLSEPNFDDTDQFLGSGYQYKV